MLTVEKLLEAKSIEFKPSGQDYVIRCLNPEHEDKNPSLRINKESGAFNCLSCGFKGNLFRHFGEKIDFLESKRRKVLNIIAEKLRETVGLNIPENAVPFQQDWRGISTETYKKFEAFQHNNPEFIGRVVFPIRDITGKIVTFCGRHQGQVDPKYLFYPSGSKTPLFPTVVPIEGKIILVEGIFDMLNLHDKGLTNAVCAFGVNKITEQKINILKIQGVTGVDIFFDNDDAGQKAATKLREELESKELSVRNITYGNLKDPGELTASQVIKIKENLYGA